jgi:orotidine-5'-phosphate decarboxylase
MDAVDSRHAPAVVALDPVVERLPPELMHGKPRKLPVDPDDIAGLLWEYGWRTIRAIHEAVPIVKINSAYFERYHAAGVQVYHDLVGEAAARGLLVIGDVKRGDVGHSAEMYAQAQLAAQDSAETAGNAVPDAVTVNGYFGADGLKPFIGVASREGKGLFVLVRTSNESAAAIQDVAAADGRKFHEVVAGVVAGLADDPNLIGERGFSAVGAVVATRDADDAVRLRAAMPRSVFLVPGYGAQGGKAEDFLPYFTEGGNGAIIAAGRSVIFAYQQAACRDRFGSDWESCVRAACVDFVADLNRAIHPPP